MGDRPIEFSVFTKPWKTMPLSELAAFVSRLGFDAIELPVRPGFQVEPQDVARGLPQAVRQFAEFGVKVASIAGPTGEAAIAACAAAGVPIIRVMVPIEPQGYWATEEQVHREYDALIPLLDRYGVKVGVQNHCDRFVCNAMGLWHLIGKYDPRHVAAVWDAAHNALQGEEPELALEIVWSHLCMVNLKNAFWRRTTRMRTSGPEAEDAQEILRVRPDGYVGTPVSAQNDNGWRPYWTSGRQGLASWPRVAAELKRRHYTGVVCLTAEYSDEPAVNRLIAEDLAYAKALFA